MEIQQIKENLSTYNMIGTSIKTTLEQIQKDFVIDNPSFSENEIFVRIINNDIIIEYVKASNEFDSEDESSRSILSIINVDNDNLRFVSKTGICYQHIKIDSALELLDSMIRDLRRQFMNKKITFISVDEIKSRIGLYWTIGSIISMLLDNIKIEFLSNNKTISSDNLTMSIDRSNEIRFRYINHVGNHKTLGYILYIKEFQKFSFNLRNHNYNFDYSDLINVVNDHMDILEDQLKRNKYN